MSEPPEGRARRPPQRSAQGGRPPPSLPLARRVPRGALTPSRQTFSSLRAMAGQAAPSTSARDAAQNAHSPPRHTREARGTRTAEHWELRRRLPLPTRLSPQASRTRRHLGRPPESPDHTPQRGRHRPQLSSLRGRDGGRRGAIRRRGAACC